MGMLTDDLDQTEEQPVEQPAPEQETMTAAEQQPIQGNSQEQFQGLKNQAIQFMYSDRFEPMIEMFKSNGSGKFPRSMAIAVNGVISELKKNNEISHETAAILGMEMFMMLLGDIAGATAQGEPIVPGLEMSQVEPALKETIDMYVQSNPDVSEQDKQALYEAIQQKQRMGGQMSPEQQASGAQQAEGMTDGIA